MNGLFWISISTLSFLHLSASTMHDDPLGELFPESSVPFPADTVLKITTLEVEPYLMQHRPARNRTGDEQYYGYIPDLLHAIATILDFRFQFYLVPPQGYGHRTAPGKWDGMVGELLNGNADVAAGPMYITDHRKQVVDFTAPFLNVQATLLLRRPPVGATATRIRSLGDLINQSEIKYGTLDRGIILRAFKRTNDTTLRILWRTIQKGGSSLLTTSNEEGIERVRLEKYAFVLPDTIGDYIARQPPCDLTTVDQFLMKRGYGLALVKGSNYLAGFNRALRMLRKSGQLDDLRQKWWSRNSDCAADSRKGRGSSRGLHSGVEDDDEEGGVRWSAASCPPRSRLAHIFLVCNLLVTLDALFVKRNSVFLGWMTSTR